MKTKYTRALCAIVLKLAADYQEELTGIIGLESSAYAPGRYNDFLHHPAIHGGELCASYTSGLCAPSSPEVAKREPYFDRRLREVVLPNLQALIAAFRGARAGP